MKPFLKLHSTHGPGLLKGCRGNLGNFRARENTRDFLMELSGLDVCALGSCSLGLTSACCSLTPFSKCSILVTAGGSLGGPGL